MTNPTLFTEYVIRGVRLKNRIVIAPMWQYRGAQGYPTDWHLMHLGRLADGGAGLVFQEGTTVERRARGTLGDLGIWDEKFVPPLARLVKVVKASGAVPGIQLMHAGPKAKVVAPMDGAGPLHVPADHEDAEDWEPIAPSAVPVREELPTPRAMTQRDIDQVIAAFMAAAGRARRAGYEVLEIHGAHGYLIHQFLSEVSNRRTDRYGGSFLNRSRFLAEIVEAVRTEWPQDRPLFLRLSVDDYHGWSVDDTVRLARLVHRLGVDVIDCSAGGLAGNPFQGAGTTAYGYQVKYAREVRARANVPTVAVGLIVHAEHAERILAEKSADLIGIAREALYNPNWPLDAAVKLGVEDAYSTTSRRTAYWLRRRMENAPDIVPSTFDPAL